MLRRILRPTLRLLNVKTSIYTYPKFIPNFKYNSVSWFSDKKQLAVSEVIADDIETKISTNIVDGEKVELVQTKGAISILDSVPGVKADNGEMYILSFCCTKCNTKSIRSFTKHAYHKGVVMVRCGGCDNIHLVADNLGWFQDTPINVQTMHAGKIQKIHDQAAISAFLQKAFNEDPELSTTHQNNQNE